MLSKTGLHAVRAIVALARLPGGAYAGAGRIAQEISAPQNYLGKLLQSLADEGLVESQKGLGGGFRLARSARVQRRGGIHEGAGIGRHPAIRCRRPLPRHLRSGPGEHPGRPGSVEHRTCL